MAFIEVAGLNKTYETYYKEKGLKGTIYNLFRRKIIYKEAVKDISFQINEGEIVGFIGMNGAGKTTTLKMLSGIIKPTKGNVTVNGHIPFDKEDEYLRQITMVMGNKSQLWWDIPAIDSFELNRDIYAIPKNKYNEILNELVESLNVSSLLSTQVRKLSLGERMKMELIAALLHEPKILFLDEPTIGIDIISQKSIYDFLKVYRESHNTTIILTSHNFDDITALCNRLILINDGCLIYDDTYCKFMEEYNTSKIITIKLFDRLNYSFEKKLKEMGEIILNENNIVKLKVKRDNTISIAKILTVEYVDYIREFTMEDMDIKELIRDLYV